MKRYWVSSYFITILVLFQPFCICDELLVMNYIAENQSQTDGFNMDNVVTNSLDEKIDEALLFPMPLVNSYWGPDGLSVEPEKRRGLAGLFKRKDVSSELLNNLRKEASSAPGSTLNRVRKLLKNHPNHPFLLMLSAVCNTGMNLNSGQEGVIGGFRIATKEAARALSNDGLSLYNCEHFLRIYHIYIERLKLHQGRTLDMIRKDALYESKRPELAHSVRISKLLQQDRKKSFSIITHLKKRMKTGQYVQFIPYLEIRRAVKKLENGLPEDPAYMGMAREFIGYIYAFCIAFSRIPAMDFLVDRMLECFGESERSLYLRKASILSVRYFLQYRYYVLEGKRKKMVEVGKKIYKINRLAVQKTDGQPICQLFESDPFLNLAQLAEMTYGLFDPQLQDQILKTGVRAAETLFLQDGTKGRLFADTARSYTHRLVLLNERKRKKT